MARRGSGCPASQDGSQLINTVPASYWPRVPLGAGRRASPTAGCRLDLGVMLQARGAEDVPEEETGCQRCGARRKWRDGGGHRGRGQSHRGCRGAGNAAGCLPQDPRLGVPPTVTAADTRGGEGRGKTPPPHPASIANRQM